MSSFDSRSEYYRIFRTNRSAGVKKGDSMIRWISLKLVALLLVFSTLVSGCGNDVADTEDETPTLDILWIPKELGNQVFETGRDGATLRAEELSALGDFRVTVTYAGPDSATDVEGQAALVRDAVQYGFEAVAVSCNTPEGLKDAIDEVGKAGIPVMTFDADSPDSSRFTYLGVDNEEGGAIAARILGETMALSALTKTAIISGVEGAANLDARVAGFTSTLAAEFPQLEIIHTGYCDDNAALCGTVIEGLLAETPDIGGFFFAGLWPLFLCEGTDCSQKMPLWDAAAKSGEIKTVVFDTLEFQLDFVDEGMVAGLVGQKYWGWGYDAVQLLYDHIVNHKTFSEWTDSGIDVVCPNNFEEMARMWENVDFTVPLSPCEINGQIIQ
jgi:ribose transport system substrate-binding protein